jgi:hypothetical protein
MVKSAIGLVLVTCVFLPACGGSDDPAKEKAGIEIEGSWVTTSTMFTGSEVIDSESWSSDYGTGATVSEIVEFSNDDNDAVLRAPDGTYGRTVWTEVSGGSFHYCTVSYGQDSVETAISESVVADDSDVDGAGCNGFSWTELARE